MRLSKHSSSHVVIARAQALRASTNGPEQALWSLLRGKQLGDRALARMGYRVLRLQAALVLEQPLVALARVREALAR